MYMLKKKMLFFSIFYVSKNPEKCIMVSTKIHNSF